MRADQRHLLFRESVDNYGDGEIADHNGSWEAGVNGAQPSLLIPARFLLGARYFQEQAPGEALDRAENVETRLSVTAPDETFEDCVPVAESKPARRPGRGGSEGVALRL